MHTEEPKEPEKAADRKATKCSQAGVPRGPYKSPAVQALVIERIRAGNSMRKIARDLQIDRGTVDRIQKQPEIAENIEQARATALAALPAISMMVHEDVVKKRDRSLGFSILKETGVYPEKDQPRTNVMLQDNRLQLALQLLPKGPKQRTTLELEAPVAPEPVAPERHEDVQRVIADMEDKLRKLRR